MRKAYLRPAQFYFFRYGLLCHRLHLLRFRASYDFHAVRVPHAVSEKESDGNAEEECHEAEQRDEFE
jgi:hypothetical protein